MDLPDPGATDPGTTGPAAPTTGGFATVSDLSTGEAMTTGGTTTDDAATTGDASSTTGDATSGDEPASEWHAKPCPAIYVQELLPTFELVIGPEELAALQAEWALALPDDLGEYPVQSFKYEDIVITDASVRLRGNAWHWPSQGKMQFEVSFNTFNEKGRFKGLKRVLLDAATYNRSFLRDRLALSVMRDVGLAAPCANNARLILNGEYYGLFTNLEKIDSEFLERHFEEPDGNLYKRTRTQFGWTRKSNEDDPDRSDMEALKAAQTLPELLALMDVDQALLELAAEAVLPDNDGAWAGGLNHYVYNDPQSGFNLLPWDLDDTFTRIPHDTDPYTYRKPDESFWGRPFFDIPTADPLWFGKYIASVDHVFTTGYRVEVLQDRIDTWAAQIAAAVAEDPNKPFSTAQHLSAVADLRSYVAERSVFLTAWLQCWKDGGTKGDDGACVP